VWIVEKAVNLEVWEGCGVLCCDITEKKKCCYSATRAHRIHYSL